MRNLLLGDGGDGVEAAGGAGGHDAKADVQVDAGEEHRRIRHLAQIPHRNTVAALERALQACLCTSVAGAGPSRSLA